MENQQEFDLIDKYLAGQCTEEEKALIESWYLTYVQKKDIRSGELNESEYAAIESEIWKAIEKRNRSAERSMWPNIRIAATILLFLSFGSYFIFHKPPTQRIAKNPIHDIAPGGNKAILTLADGKQIVLTSAQNGTLAKQGVTTINKTRDGQVVYTGAPTIQQNPQLIAYNSIQTPCGGQYHLTLADGTNVWLNAASSIKYPVAFNTNERKVEITGEAYFEVKHDKTKPFRVVCNGQTVEDIGTSFNINSYSDESAIKTTLLEGSVKVSSAGENKILIPGEQALLEKGSIRTKNVDIDEVVAWKNGDFMFKDEDFKTAMRQVARWYNVEMVYDPSAPIDIVPGGWISRTKNISSVLKLMELTGNVHFKIEGRRIIVTK